MYRSGAVLYRIGADCDVFVFGWPADAALAEIGKCFMLSALSN